MDSQPNDAQEDLPDEYRSANLVYKLSTLPDHLSRELLRVGMNSGYFQSVSINNWPTEERKKLLRLLNSFDKKHVYASDSDRKIAEDIGSLFERTNRQRNK